MEYVGYASVDCVDTQALCENGACLDSGANVWSLGTADACMHAFGGGWAGWCGVEWVRPVQVRVCRSVHGRSIQP